MSFLTNDMKNKTIKTICIFLGIILISFLIFINITKIKIKEPINEIEIVNIKDVIDNGDIEEYIGDKVIFEFSKINQHDLYDKMYYICIDDKVRYNVFLEKKIKINDDGKRKKIVGFINNVNNNIIFIKPESVVIIE